MAEYRVTGLSPTVIAELVAEVGPLWHEGHQARLAARPRRRAVGAVTRHRFVFVDRLPATLVSLRHGTTHDVLAFWFGVDRSTITRAIGEVRPLLARRGCTVAPDDRLRVLQPGPAGQLRRHHAGATALFQFLADGPFMEILADAGYQGMGALTGGRVVTPPHRTFKKNAPA